MFNNCYLLDKYLGQEEDSADGLFSDNTQLTCTTGLFNNCHNLRGRIPPNMFKNT